jgi:hypothetical protein
MSKIWNIPERRVRRVSSVLTVLTYRECICVRPDYYCIGSVSVSTTALIEAGLRSTPYKDTAVWCSGWALNLYSGGVRFGLQTILNVSWFFSVSPSGRVLTTLKFNRLTSYILNIRYHLLHAMTQVPVCVHMCVSWGSGESLWCDWLLVLEFWGTALNLDRVSY